MSFTRMAEIIFMVKPRGETMVGGGTDGTRSFVFPNI